MGDLNGTVTVFDAGTNRRIGSYQAPAMEIFSVEFGPAGDRLAVTGVARVSGAPEGRLLLIDARTQRLYRSVVLRHPSGTKGSYVPIVSYDLGGRSLVIAYTPLSEEAKPPRLRRHDADTGAPLGRARIVARDAGFFRGFFQGRNGRLVYAGIDATYVIDGDSLRGLRRYRGDENSALDPSGGTLALGSEKGRLRLLELRTGRTRSLGAVAADFFRSMAFSPGWPDARDGHAGRSRPAVGRQERPACRDARGASGPGRRAALQRRRAHAVHRRQRGQRDRLGPVRRAASRDMVRDRRRQAL
jgi:WD40 repeat protein